MTHQDHRSSLKSFNHTINAAFDSILPNRKIILSDVLKEQPKCSTCSYAFSLCQVRMQCCHTALAEHHGCEQGTQVDILHNQVPNAVQLHLISNYSVQNSN